MCILLESLPPPALSESFTSLSVSTDKAARFALSIACEWLSGALNVGLGNLVAIKEPEARGIFAWHIESRIQGSIEQWYLPQIAEWVDSVLAPIVASQNLACGLADDVSRLDKHVDFEVFNKKRCLMSAFTENVRNFHILTESDPLVLGATMQPLQEDPNTPQDKPRSRQKRPERNWHIRDKRTNYQPRWIASKIEFFSVVTDSKRKGQMLMRPVAEGTF